VAKSNGRYYFLSSDANAISDTGAYSSHNRAYFRANNNTHKNSDHGANGNANSSPV